MLAAIPAQARYLSWALAPGATRTQLAAALHALAAGVDGGQAVLGLGRPLLDALGLTMPGLEDFAAPVGSRVEMPATQAALWLWLRGDDAGELLHRGAAFDAQGGTQQDLAIGRRHHGNEELDELPPG
ncbi:MAG: hypothetical protein RLZZ584_1442 [Pseudomonadota bacterium]